LGRIATDHRLSVNWQSLLASVNIRVGAIQRMNTNLDQPELWRELLKAQEPLPKCFERVASLYPERLALGSDTWQPTYVELNAAANRMAYALIDGGLAPGHRVAILMQHDAPLIGALLCVLKARGMAVILNPNDPIARLQQVAEDADPQIVLTDAATRPFATEALGSTRTLMEFEVQAAAGNDCNPGLWASPDDTAMLCYTSGSTGRPKALMMSHRMIVHNAARISQAMQMSPNDRVASLASLSTYSAVNTAWSALENGASLWPFATAQRGVTGLAEWIADREITIYVSSSSLFRHFMATLPASASLPRIRSIRLTAEAATSGDFKAFQQHFSDSCTFIHTLASTETGQITRVVLKRSDVVPEGRLPVGHPADGVEVLLLDETGAPVPDGDVGEIVVRSRYVFNGYWRNDELTAKQLSDDPAGNGLRRCHTGDFGRRGAGGMLEYIGRSDAMLKIRGYRIEIAEIESALRRLPEIADALVRPQQEPGHEPQLVAYVVLRSGHSTSAAGLRRALRGVLPEYMIPSTFATLDGFPRTPYGKIDLSQLHYVRKPDAKLGSDVALWTQTEQLLADLWSVEFKLQVGRDSDFFELGGDSLIATVIGARLHSAIGVEVDIAAFATHTTVATLAARIEEMRGERDLRADIPLVRVDRNQPLPASFYQERAWVGSRAPDGGGYSGAYADRIVGALDREALHDCINYLARRHEGLRTNFTSANGQILQTIGSFAPAALTFVDLAGAGDAEARANAILAKESARSFDLARGPLVQFVLIRIHDNEHWLVRACHHIIHDAWSWQLFMRELGLLYEARLRGEAPPLPQTESLQYADYAAWQRRTFAPGSPAREAAIQWWAASLDGAPRKLDLPFRRGRPLSGGNPAEGVMHLRLDARTAATLGDLGRIQRATFYMVRLAAFVALLSITVGHPDLTVATYVSNRRSTALQGVFGFFINLVILRFRCDPNMSFRDWLSIVRKQVVDAERHAEIPFDVLREELQQRGTGMPDVQAIFTVSRHIKRRSFGGLELTKMEYATAVMPWGFTLDIEQHSETNAVVASFDANMYDPARVRVLVERYSRMLDAAAAKPDRSLRELLAESADDRSVPLPGSV
jgi:amino acid adenylation domain-containing protein